MEGDENGNRVAGMGDINNIYIWDTKWTLIEDK